MINKILAFIQVILTTILTVHYLQFMEKMGKSQEKIDIVIMNFEAQIKTLNKKIETLKEVENSLRKALENQSTPVIAEAKSNWIDSEIIIALIPYITGGAILFATIYFTPVVMAKIGGIASGTLVTIQSFTRVDEFGNVVEVIIKSLPNGASAFEIKLKLAGQEDFIPITNTLAKMIEIAVRELEPISLSAVEIASQI